MNAVICITAQNSFAPDGSCADLATNTACIFSMTYKGSGGQGESLERKMLLLSSSD